jgi:hypothetical protein
MLVRLLVGLDETSSSLDAHFLQPLLLAPYHAGDLDALIAEAKKLRRTDRTEGTSSEQAGSNNGTEPYSVTP